MLPHSYTKNPSLLPVRTYSRSSLYRRRSPPLFVPFCVLLLILLNSQWGHCDDDDDELGSVRYDPEKCEQKEEFICESIKTPTGDIKFVHVADETFFKDCRAKLLKNYAISIEESLTDLKRLCIEFKELDEKQCIDFSMYSNNALYIVIAIVVLVLLNVLAILLLIYSCFKSAIQAIFCKKKQPPPEEGGEGGEEDGEVVITKSSKGSARTGGGA